MIKNILVKNITLLNKARYFLVWLGLMLIPSHVAIAQGGAYPQNIETIGDIISLIDAVIADLIPIAASLALLAFFWGLAKYIFKAGNEDAQQQGKEVMIAGVVGLFLIAAVGGIINLLAGTIGIENPGSTNIDYPSVAPDSSG